MAGVLHVKLDASYPDDPKIIEAGEKAELLYVRSLCLAKRILSDGFIADAHLPRFGLSGVNQRAKTLCDVGLWERDDEAGGYWIRAWLKHNSSAAHVEEVRRKRKQAGSKGGKRSAEQDAKRSAEQSADQNAEQSASPPSKQNAKQGATPEEVGVEERGVEDSPEGGADAPEPPGDGTLLPMDPEQRGDPSRNGQSEKFSTRLARELEAEHGVEFGTHDTAHESFMALLREALDRLPVKRRQTVAMGVIADYAAFTGAKLTRQARDHTAKLVRTHDPPRVLEAYGEATLWGAGLSPEHAEDPLALSKYVAGCLSKWKESA